MHNELRWQKLSSDLFLEAIIKSYEFNPFSGLDRCFLEATIKFYKFNPFSGLEKTNHLTTVLGTAWLYFAGCPPQMAIYHRLVICAIGPRYLSLFIIIGPIYLSLF